MTCSELSAQKGTELTKHLSQLLFLLKLLTDINVQLPGTSREREDETVLLEELVTDFHNMPQAQLSVSVSVTTVCLCNYWF